MRACWLRSNWQLRAHLSPAQVTASFKARGAVALVSALTPDALAAGVVTSSTGNHGLAIAYAWASLPAAAASGGRLRVYVPSTAVATKVRKIVAQVRYAPRLRAHGHACTRPAQALATASSSRLP